LIAGDTSTVLSKQEFLLASGATAVTTEQPLGVFMYVYDTGTNALVPYDDAFKAYATIKYA